MNHYDIIIIGGGMVGSLLSCLLSRSQLRIAIIEKQTFDASKQTETATQVNDFYNRISAITPLSAQLITAADAWQQITQQRCCAYQHMHVWEQDGTAELNFDARDIASNQLGYMIENQLIQSALAQQSQQHPNITWWQNSVSQIKQLNQSQGRSLPINYHLTLDNQQQLSCTLLIGADGALSFVRNTLGFPIKEKSLNQLALVCTVQTEKPHNKTAYQIFRHNGPLAFLPLSAGTDSTNEHFCSIVWSCQHDDAKQLLAQNKTQFAESLTQALEYKLGNVIDVSSVQSFPLIQRHAYYIKDNAVLLGDAAHTVHPLAGQGVNLGFWDAGILAEEIIDAINHNLPWHDDAILRKFQRRRRWHNQVMQQSFTQLNALYQTKSLPLKLLRNLGVNFVNNTQPIKRLFIEQATGKHSDAPNLSILYNH